MKVGRRGGEGGGRETGEEIEEGGEGEEKVKEEEGRRKGGEGGGGETGEEIGKGGGA